MDRIPPRVVPLESVPPVSAEDAPTKVKIARLVTTARCGSNLLLGVAWLEPGDQTNVWSAHAEDTTSPDEHWYGRIEETYFVLQGRLRLTWDEGVLEFGPSDAVYLAPEWRYHLEKHRRRPGDSRLWHHTLARVSHMTELTDSLRRFLAEPIVGVLATIRKDGSPHLTAVWYVYETDEVKLTITDGRAKYRHLMRDPRVSLAVANNDPPYKEVVLEGRAQVTDEGGHDFFRRLAVRYYGEQDGNAYADYSEHVAKEHRLIASFKPERVRAWDFAVEDDYHRPWLPSSFDATLGTRTE